MHISVPKNIHMFIIEDIFYHLTLNSRQKENVFWVLKTQKSTTRTSTSPGNTFVFQNH